MVFHVARALDLVRRGRAALELVEDHPVRLLEHLGEHVEASAVGHAEDDFLDAQRTAALDDLLERRNQRLGAVKAEALGAGIFDVDELLEAFRLDELVEDRLLAFRGEGDALVRPFDALLDPAFLGSIRDVHELDAERAAISAPQDLKHLRDGGELQPEHIVDEDPAAVVGRGEAIGGRVEVGFALDGLQAEGVEPGVEVAAHAVGADHHDRPHRIARRPEHGVVGEFDAARRQALADLLREDGLLRRPIAVEGGDQLAIGDDRPVRPLPAGTVGFPEDVFRRVLQAFEE